MQTLHVTFTAGCTEWGVVPSAHKKLSLQKFWKVSLKNWGYFLSDRWCEELLVVSRWKIVVSSFLKIFPKYAGLQGSAFASWHAWAQFCCETNSHQVDAEVKFYKYKSQNCFSEVFWKQHWSCFALHLQIIFNILKFVPGHGHTIL